MEFAVRKRRRSAGVSAPLVTLILAQLLFAGFTSSQKTVSFAIPDATPQGAIIGVISAPPGFVFSPLSSRYLTLSETGVLLSSVAFYRSVIFDYPLSEIAQALMNSTKAFIGYQIKVYITTFDPLAPRFDPSLPLNYTVFAGRNMTNTIALWTSYSAASGIDYLIIGGNNDGVFALTTAIVQGRLAAVLTTAQPPPLSPNAYNLTLSAQISSSVRRGYVGITVQIADPSGYQPTLIGASASGYSASVQINTPIQVPVLQLQASVPLASSGLSRLSYAMANNSLFVADPSTGIVTARTDLNSSYRSEQPYCNQSKCGGASKCLTSCTVPVWAANTLIAAPNEQLLNTSTVSIAVTSAPDLVPDFVVGFVATANVSEAASQGTPVMQFTINDSGDASLVAGDPAGEFATNCIVINVITFCQIEVRGPLDNHARPAYDLVVRIRAGTQPFLYRSLAVTVTAVPLTWPAFMEAYYVATVDIGDSIGTVLATVQAAGSHSGKVLYGIASGDPAGGYGQFTVDPYTGEVSLRLSASAAAAGTRTALLSILNVSATDWKHPGLVAYTQVFVYLAPQQGALLCNFSALLYGSSSAVAAAACTPAAGLYPARYWSSVPFWCGSSSPVANVSATACLLADLGGLQRRCLSVVGSPAQPTPSIASGSAYFQVTANGLLTIARQLPAPGGEYRVTALLSAAAVASNGGLSSRSVAIIASILVLIRDPLEAPIAFEHPQGYTATVYADEMPTKILQVTAYGRAAAATYALVDSGPAASQLFVMAPGSGEISLLGSGSQLATSNLNASVYQLTVVARSGSRLTSVNVTVVAFSSAGPPEFADGTQARTYVPEDAAVGEVVYAASASSVHGVTYSLWSNSSSYGSSLFSLDSTTGIVRVATCPGGLIAMTTLSLAIAATDRGSRGLTSLLLLNITVTDVNDHNPQFAQKKYAVFISESTTPGVGVLAQISATDADWGANGRITYELDPIANGGGTFSMLPGGYLKLVGPVDRELVSAYMLVVVATDGGRPARSSSVSVGVWLTDVNDNSPQFLAVSYSFSVLENSVAGIVLGQVVALDADSGRNGRVFYRAYGLSAMNFNVDPTTGLIVTSSFPLDREALAAATGSNVIILTVAASDEGVPARTSAVNVTITVLDVNDNAPSFGVAALHVSLREDTAVGFVAAVLNASDADTGLNGCITYSLAGSAQFSFIISGSTLVLAGPLDRDARSHYVLTVIASDAGSPTSLSTSVLIGIVVMGADDSPPIFDPLPQLVTVAENVPPGSYVFRLRATDADLGDGVAIEYRIVGGSGNDSSAFGIDRYTGVLYAASWLDFESQSIYNLLVSATNPAAATAALRSSTLNVTVTIGNVNEPPRFASSPYVAFINESIQQPAASGSGTNSSWSPVVQVSAVDPDRASDVTLLYSIVLVLPTDDIFTIDPASGWLYVKPHSVIDREQISSYRVTVAATEQARPGLAAGVALSAQTVVTVVVVDVNDNAPLLTSPRAATVAAGSPAGTLVMVLEASDADGNSNAQIRYSLASASSACAVEATTGRLVLSRALPSSATLSNFSVVVQATDSGRPALSSQQAVDIIVLPNAGTGRTESGIAFEQATFAAAVPESSPIGTSIATVMLRSSSPAVLAAFYLTSAVAASGVSIAASLTIDPSSGVLRVARPLTCNLTCSTYNLTVYVADLSGNVGTPGRVQVLVTIVANSPPAFDNNVYTAVVREKGAVGEVVSIVRATDHSGGSGNVSYSTLSKDAGCRFAMNSSTGVVSTLAALDYSQTPICIIQLSACNSAGCAKSMLYVTVLAKPIFTSATYYFVVPLGGSVGLPVGRAMLANSAAAVESPDSASGGQPASAVTYWLAGSWGLELFQLNATTGVLRLQAPLSKGTQAKLYVLDVIATVGGVRPYNATATLYITPSPDAESTGCGVIGLSVPENAVAGTAAGLPLSSRPYAELGGRYAYAIGDGDWLAQFSITPVDGRVTAATLDRESIPLYSLVVIAVDPVDASVTATATAVITVLDVNDNAPIFTSPAIAQVTENEPSPQLVMRCSACDTDAGANGTTEYYLMSVSSSGNLFAIDRETGVLTTVVTLDREATPAYNLTIMARDQGSPPQSTLMTVTVLVADVNDNGPRFAQSQQTSTTVPENAPAGTTVLTLSAFDPDAGLNGTVRYYLLPGEGSDDFSLDSISGALTVGPAGLNYQARRNYALIVQASDLGYPLSLQSGALKLSVSVTYAWDGMATFLNAPFYWRLTENMPTSPGLCVGKLTAEQPVGGATFRLAPADADLSSPATTAAALLTVAVDPISGTTVATRTVDREIYQQFILSAVLVGVDNTTGLATAMLTMTIAQVNDHPPIFEVPFYAVDVAEGRPAGTPVLTVTATDPDPAGDPNITYSLFKSYGLFDVDARTGAVTLLAPLDREAEDFFLLYVVASDNGTPSLNARVPISVYVGDINDNVPTFMQPSYSATAPAAITAGMFLLGVIAVDPDLGANGTVSYSMLGAPAGGLLQINNTTGVITATYAAIMDPRNTISTTVRAQDMGGMFSDVSVNVTFSTTSISCTYVSRPAVVTVMETAPVGTVVLAVSASSGVGLLTYWIAGGNLGDSFGVDLSTGALTVKHALDYERFSFYTLWIGMSVGNYSCLPTYMAYTLAVSNVNDHAPRFASYLVRATVREEVAPAVLPPVAVLYASDTEPGVNGTLQYRLNAGLSSATPLPFRVDPNSGIVFVTAPLDREVASSYTIVIEAYDIGPAPLTATALLLVTVADANDHAPVFAHSYSWAVSERAPAGTVVGKVTATDSDLENNGFITYSLLDNFGAFAVNQSGMVVTKYPLDWELKSAYVLTIVASNSLASPILSTAVKANVTVLDLNDNAPVFQPTALFSFVVDASDWSLPNIGRVYASDADAPGPNSLVQYTLRAPSMLFTINSSSGFIYAQQAIAYTVGCANRYVLYIVALDRGMPPLSSVTATVTITIVSSVAASKVNIQWSSSRGLWPSLPSDLPINATVLHLKPTVTGSAVFMPSQTIYGNGSTVFRISPCGEVTLQQSLAGYIGATFQLTAWVMDLLTGLQLSNMSLTLSITASNVYVPMFSTMDSYNYTVGENASLGYVIATMKATDQDQGINGQVKFFIVDGNDRGWFSLGEDDGVLRVANSLDFTVRPSSLLTVKAEDQGFFKRAAWQPVSILITTALPRPSFAGKSYVTYVPDGSSAGTALITVTALCRPWPPSTVPPYVTYAILRTADAPLFSIDPSAGLIRTAATLDFKVKSAYRIRVVAYSPLTPAYNDTADVEIGVVGGNRYPPMFLQSTYHFPWPAATATNSSIQVGMVSAIDLDAGAGGVIEFFLVGDSNDSGFTIDLLSGALWWSPDGSDRARTVIRLQYAKLIVFAKNVGPLYGSNRWSMCTVEVGSLQQAFSFTSSIYNVTLADSSSVATCALVVRTRGLASVKDFRFVIVDFDINDTVYFGIHPLSGVITTAMLLPSAASRKEYLFSVQAVDESQHVLAIATVAVNTFTPAAAAPYFVPTTQPQVAVLESLSAVSFVVNLGPLTRVRGTTTGAASQPFRYSVADPAFAIDSVTGILVTATSLSAANQSSFLVIVNVACTQTALCTPASLSVLVTVFAADAPPGTADLAVTVPYSGSLSALTPIDIVDFALLAPWYSLLGPGLTDCTLMASAGSSDVSLAFLTRSCRLQLLATPAAASGSAGGMAVVASANVSVQRLDTMATTSFTVTVTAVPYDDEAQLMRSSLVLFEALQPEELARQWLPLYIAQVAAILSSSSSTGTMPIIKSISPLSSRGSVAVLTVAAATGTAITVATLSSAADGACNVLRRSAGVTCSSQPTPCTLVSCPGPDSVCVDSYRPVQPLQMFGGWPSAVVVPGAAVTASCSCASGPTSANCTAPAPSCKVSPCRNGGSCRPPSTGPVAGGVSVELTCDCPPAYFGRYCESLPQGFSDASYAVFGGLSASSSSSIELTFATYLSRALLAYRVDDVNSSSSTATGRALAVQVLDGRINMRVAASAGLVSSLTLNRTVSTGSWFRVAARYTAGVGSYLQLVPCSGPTNCSNCTPSDSACAATLADSTSSSTRAGPSAASSTLSVGGLASLVPGSKAATILSAATYRGCIASLTVDHVDLSFDDAAKSGLKAGCGDTSRSCEGSSSCSSGSWTGTCTAGIGGAMCSCMAGSYAAESCASVPGVPASLAESAFVTYRRTVAYQRLAFLSPASARRRRRSLPTSGRVISLAVRTERPNGGLLLVRFSTSLWWSLQIADGRAALRLGEQLHLVNAKVQLNNSAWHVLEVTLRPSSADLSVDGLTVQQVATTADYYTQFDPIGTDVQEIVLAPQQLSTAAGFIGCLQNFTIDGMSMPVANASTDQFVATVAGGISYSCSLCDSCTTSAISCSASASSGGCAAAVPSTEPALASWKLIVAIVVPIVVAFGLVLGLVLAFFWCKKRRRQQKKQKAVTSTVPRPASGRSTSARPADSSLVHSSFDNGAFDSMNSTRPLGHIDESDFANPLAAAKSNRGGRVHVLTTRTVPSPAYDQQEDNVVIIENSVDSGGERREFYDLDAASIAPSDVDDMAGYYKGYRSSARGGRPNADRGSPADVASALRARPKSAAPLGGGAQSSAGRRVDQPQRSVTPGAPLHDRKGRSPPTLSHDRQLRGIAPMERQQQPPAPPLGTNRRTPVDELQMRAAMLRRTPVEEPRPRAGARRTPVDELQRRVAEVSGRRSRGYREGSDSSDLVATYDEGESPAVGRSRPGSRPAQPRAESRVGVHAPHNLNRLSNQSLTSESESDGTPPDDGGPLERRNICIDDSTSEDTSNDSFTASEFEAELEPKIRNDQYPGGMMFTKLQEVDDESDAADSVRARSAFAWESIRSSADGHQALSRFLHQPSSVAKNDHLTKGSKPEGSGSFRWDYFFSWGPSFEKLAGVFSDIAMLPSDDEILSMKIAAKVNLVPSRKDVNTTPSRKEDYV